MEIKTEKEKLLYSCESESIKECIEEAVKIGVNLGRADLRAANLTDANLTDVNLTDAKLTRARLFWVNLSGANLTGANLSRVDLKKAIDLNPQDAEAYYNRGLAYDELSNYNQAIKDYTKVIELDPQLVSEIPY